MKKFTYTIIIAAALFTSCNNNTPKSESADITAATADTSAIAATDSALATYQCPMKCQGDTTYNAPGKCPVCEMDLEKL